MFIVNVYVYLKLLLEETVHFKRGLSMDNTCTPMLKCSKKELNFHHYTDGMQKFMGHCTSNVQVVS